jgi:hypothetical protein
MTNKLFAPISSISSATTEGIEAVCGILITNDKSVANIAQKMCDLVYNVVDTTDQHVSKWSQVSLAELNNMHQVDAIEAPKEPIPKEE